VHLSPPPPPPPGPQLLTIVPPARVRNGGGRLYKRVHPSNAESVVELAALRQTERSPFPRIPTPRSLAGREILEDPRQASKPRFQTAKYIVSPTNNRTRPKKKVLI
jgi:hypothetical protein